MARIWANRLEAGTQVWSSVPAFRKESIKKVMAQDVKYGRISEERYEEICGEKYVDTSNA